MSNLSAAMRNPRESASAVRDLDFRGLAGQSRAATPLMAESGYGQGYRYVHDDPLARQQMPARPAGLEGRVYFER